MSLNDVKLNLHHPVVNVLHNDSIRITLINVPKISKYFAIPIKGKLYRGVPIPQIICIFLKKIIYFVFITFFRVI